MRIAILTFHRAYNCGAALQAWALKTVLERMGHMVEFPNCNAVGFSKRWQIAWTNPEKRGLGWARSLVGRIFVNLCSIPNEDVLRRRYRRFRRMHWVERECRAEDLEKQYDLIVVGSDQVWNAACCGRDLPLFLAENLPPSLPKIAYAASCGDGPLDEKDCARVAAALGRFAAVSVREKLAQSQLEPLAERRLPVVVDPTLLLDPNDYASVRSPTHPRGDYLFVYALFLDRFMWERAHELARRLGLRCVIAPCYQYSRYGAPEGLTYALSPDRLVSYIQNAKCVLAGSFHGTALALLFGKSVLALRERASGSESRPAHLLDLAGCPERLVAPSDSVAQMERLFRAPLPETTPAKLSTAREASLSWFNTAISRTIQL